ncbi:hypothetical protein Pan241w_18150 [Gimesia alba]|uniref:Uncharacterized protein n=1 Tax=Gimesia alba TaxID=2527973 RepID=A0A517RCZ3_9PLAN|nr:hypothetical protein Pan241w_18150 [Gimesia alba]
MGACSGVQVADRRPVSSGVMFVRSPKLTVIDVNSYMQKLDKIQRRSRISQLASVLKTKVESWRVAVPETRREPDLNSRTY